MIATAPLPGADTELMVRTSPSPSLSLASTLSLLAAAYSTVYASFTATGGVLTGGGKGVVDRHRYGGRGRAALSVTNAVGEAVRRTATARSTWRVDDFAAGNRCRALAGCGYRGDGQRVAIGIGVVAQYVEGDWGGTVDGVGVIDRRWGAIDVACRYWRTTVRSAQASRWPMRAPRRALPRFFP